ncbi:MAG TPA: hypothetical protein VIJ14_02630 [Rhabdochlamydiaceae bacterium]
MAISTFYFSLMTLEQDLVRYKRLVTELHVYSDGPVEKSDTYRCLQIVSRKLVDNLSLRCATMTSFLHTNRTLESLEEELEPLINQYDAHRRLWLMFTENIPMRQCPRTPAQ